MFAFSNAQARGALALYAIALIILAGCNEDGGPAVPTTIALVAGDGQTAQVKQNVAAAPSVKVTDAEGKGVSGVSVTFAVSSGGGAVTGGSQTTNAGGIATVGSWELGTAVGANTLTAASGSLAGSPVVFMATTIPGPPANVAVSAGAGQAATVGTTVAVPPSIKVTDAFGNNVSGVTATFAVTAGGGSLSGGSQSTNAAGIATVGGWTLGVVAGTNTLTATATGVSGGQVSFNAAGSAAAAATIAVNAGNSQSAVAGTALAVAPSVKITDTHGNPVLGSSVTFAITSGGGTLTGATTTSNTSGIATVGSWTLGNTAGANTMTATSGTLSGSPVTFSATGVPGPAASIAAFSGNNQTAAPGTAVTAPAVKVSDSRGNGVASVTVTFAVASGGGSITGATPQTNSSGIATVGSWTLGSSPGTNTMTATAAGLTGSPVTFSAIASSTICSETAIAIGQTRTGTLASGDCTFDDGSFVDQYHLSLSTSTTVQIDLSSAAFDAYLILAQSGTALRYDDDGGGGTNSRITTTLAAGEYTVLVTSYSSGETGAYSLTVAQGSASCFVAGTLTLGTPSNGALANTDCLLNDGRYADPWILTLSSTTAVRLKVDAAGFDTYAILTRQDGTIISEDDDGGTGLNALIETTLAAGTYYLWATSFAAGVTGSYTVSAASAGAACSTAVTLVMGTPTNGTLATTDCAFSGGNYTDPLQFTLASGASVTVSMTSTAFDTYLILANSAGTIVAEDDDGGTGTNSRLTATLAAGTYTVWATSFSASVTGAYQITATAASSGCQSSTTVAVGQTVSGSLASSDCQLADGSYVDRWSLTLSATTSLTVDLTSSAFDTYLYITDASGATLAADDDGGGGTNSRVQISLAAGTYIVYANSFAAGATGAYSLAVAGTTGGGGTLNLRVDRVYLTQSTQTLIGSVPILAGRDALVRVFVRANQTNSALPTVRLRLQNASGTIVRTQIINAPGASVPTSLSEGTLNSSWNFVVPAAEVTVGMKLLADVDPTNAIVESSDADNSYPISGAYGAIDVRTMPTFNITMVPVNQSVNNRTGNVTSGNALTVLAKTRALWPIVGVNVLVRATYTTSLPALQSLDQNGSWSALLSEINALRAVEAPTRFYHGILNVSYSSGIAGLGYLGVPAAISWDDPASVGEVVAHELGHNFGRLHAPCGNPGGPDPNYPYAGGAIGVYGNDVGAGTLKSNTLPDIMSYCNSPWVSDYTYQGALDFLKAGSNYIANANGSQPTESLLLWGRVTGGKVLLEPAIELTAVPSVIPDAGAFRLEGFDAAGGRILSIAFDPDEVSEELPVKSRHFAFVVPKQILGDRQLSSLRLSGLGSPAAELHTAATGSRLIMTAPPAVSRVAGDEVRVQWNAGVYGMALVRSARTGEILAFARNGDVTVSTADSELDVTLTDGVRSVHQRIVLK